MKMSAYHTNPEVRARVLERSRQWSSQNPDRRKEIQLAYNQRRRCEPWTWAKYMVGSIKRRAAKKGIPFDLSESDIFAGLPDDGKCPVLGIELTLGGGRITRETASIDRIRPQFGYVKGNIAVIS